MKTFPLEADPRHSSHSYNVQSHLAFQALASHSDLSSILASSLSPSDRPRDLSIKPSLIPGFLNIQYSPRSSLFCCSLGNEKTEDQP
ncbi:hypothetical protein NLI96_g6207 [Meripilus lineatus]|uniref:Uncharacterized protein n=1 Tax=Meripilus lineatus TaxID=2056292 RepID=A0AAD5V693_9APHY|nr:hypothetical protein NLI96_g6207 [Physisporinus lineatus]